MRVCCFPRSRTAISVAPGYHCKYQLLLVISAFFLPKFAAYEIYIYRILTLYRYYEQIKDRNNELMRVCCFPGSPAISVAPGYHCKYQLSLVISAIFLSKFAAYEIYIYCILALYRYYVQMKSQNNE